MNYVGLKVERTGAVYGINSSEYKVSYPDGTSETLWSPNWNEYSKEEEDREAILEAMRRWDSKQ